MNTQKLYITSKEKRNAPFEVSHRIGYNLPNKFPGRVREEQRGIKKEIVQIKLCFPNNETLGRFRVELWNNMFI